VCVCMAEEGIWKPERAQELISRFRFRIVRLSNFFLDFRAVFLQAQTAKLKRIIDSPAVLFLAVIYGYIAKPVSLYFFSLRLD
jgi:hypothetical protein